MIRHLLILLMALLLPAAAGGGSVAHAIPAGLNPSARVASISYACCEHPRDLGTVRGGTACGGVGEADGSRTTTRSGLKSIIPPASADPTASGPEIASAVRYEAVPFGDFENWAVRNIRESAILGGETKTIYNPGPAEIINRNEAYDYSKTPWTSSNAYAVIAGITKTSCSVSPQDGPDGKCARLVNCFAECKVAGIINIKVLVAGTLLWGRMKEPVSSINDPYASLDWGIPFTKRPSALILDYKATIPDSGTLTKGTTFSTKTFPGHDPAEVVLLLQNRWEDEQGNIHAKRVGTAVYRIRKSTGGWVKGKRIPVIYGDARKSEAYRPYMDLLGASRPVTATNSRGRSRVIQEEWGEADSPVTHAILIISSGSSGAFVGEPGNELLIDKLRLEFI